MTTIFSVSYIMGGINIRGTKGTTTYYNFTLLDAVADYYKK